MDKRTIRSQRALTAGRYVKLREDVAQCEGRLRKDCRHCKNHLFCQLKRDYTEANRTLTAMNRG